MRSGKLRIAFFGNFGTGNLGNDGSLEAMLDAVREMRPDAELTCICPDPLRVTAKYGIHAVPVNWPRPERRWFRLANVVLLKAPSKLADLIYAFNRTRDLDVVIMPGTGLLASIGEPIFGWPYHLFSWCLASRLNGGRLLFVSTGAGPIPNPISRCMMTSAARLASYRSFRDADSRARLLQFGLHSEGDPVYPDVAFGLRPPPVHRNNNPRLTIGVGVMAYHGWRSTRRERDSIYEAYRAKITDFIIYLLDRGYTVRLIIGEDTDQLAVDHVLAAIRCNSRHYDGVVAEPACSLDEVMGQMSTTDVVIATRFHNVICSLMAGRPLVCLGYSAPHEELMEKMGLATFFQNVESFDTDLLIRQLDTLLCERHEHESRIRRICRDYRKLLARQNATLATSYLR